VAVTVAVLFVAAALAQLRITSFDSSGERIWSNSVTTAISYQFSISCTSNLKTSIL